MSGSMDRSEMFVGGLKVRLLVREARSLKDKRQVVRGIKDRLHNDLGVCAAEVGALEDHRQAILGFSTVANEAAQARQVLEQVVARLRAHPVAEFCGHELEVLSFDELGGGEF
ncbi:MAG: DUF503 domain-containing protein [Gemmataceae bacterium]|nr:DUF503 domain-containing protein [Gemmataceae bacterium]